MKRIDEGTSADLAVEQLIASAGRRDGRRRAGLLILLAVGLFALIGPPLIGIDPAH